MRYMMLVRSIAPLGPSASNVSRSRASLLPVSHTTVVNSFHEKAGRSQDGFVFTYVDSLPLSRAASVAILPSAVFFERLSLAARWASSIQ